MRYWIIQHKVSKDYLPQPDRGGATWYDPEPVNRRRRPPRLFTNPGDARKALAWWYDGPWGNSRYDGDDGSYPEPLSPTHKARIAREKYRGEMEVVEIWLDMKGRP